MLNVLLSFAQFEREIISERTRDKIAATRRKGKWSGGMPLLGYDVDPRGSKLVVNEDEAARVRAIFELYLEHQSLLPVVQELDRRGWANKRWTTRKGHERGGKPFTKTSLYKLLTNVTYIGKVTYKDEVHDGEHAAIVSDRDLATGAGPAAAQRPHGRRAGPQQVRRAAQRAFCAASPATAPCRRRTPPATATSGTATTSAPTPRNAAGTTARRSRFPPPRSNGSSSTRSSASARTRPC